MKPMPTALSTTDTSSVLYVLDDMIERETDTTTEDITDYGVRVQAVRDAVQATCPTCDPSEPPPAS